MIRVRPWHLVAAGGWCITVAAGVLSHSWWVWAGWLGGSLYGAASWGHA